MLLLPFGDESWSGDESNNYDTPIIEDGLDVATLDNYIGFGRVAGADASIGPRIGVLDVDPSAGAGVVAPVGSLIVRYTPGSVQVWVKQMAADTAWTQIGTVASVALADNQANAFQFAEGANIYLRFVTTNGAERLRIDQSIDLGATLGTTDLDIEIRDNSATALEIRPGVGGAPVMLGFNTTNGAETLFSAATGLTTTTANFQWTLADNVGTALQIGSAGALGILAFNTTNGGEEIVLGGALGARFNDTVPLRFGTPGTDLVFTPDGTDVTISGTGALQLNDNVPFRLGTLGGGFSGSITATPATISLVGGALVAPGATAATAAFSFATGTRTTSDAAVGNGSGAFSLRSGATNCTNAGGTAGASGTFTIGSGNSTSTAGLSGNSGATQIVSGNSEDGASGEILIQSGTAATTRGSLRIDVPTIDLTTPATGIVETIRDNLGGALIFRESTANNYLALVTTNNNEHVELGGVSSQAGTTSPWVQTDGADFGTRIVLVYDCDQRPAIAADIANNNASKVMEVMGTNSTSALATFATGGGIALTTAGAAADQEVIRGNTVGADSSQSPWVGTTWSTSDQLLFKCNLRIVDTANLRVGCGMKLTLTAGATLMDSSTDADQVWFGFDNPGATFGAGSDTNWFAIISIANVDSHATTGVAVAAGNFRFIISVDAARVARFYVNGVLTNTSGALTAATAFLPFAGVQQTGGAAARTVTIQKVGISKVFSA